MERIPGATLVSTTFVAIAVTVLPMTPSRAQDPGMAGPEVYRLTDRATYQRGCFPPCFCPLAGEVAVRGTFTLVPAGLDPAERTFAIEDVNWTVDIGSDDLRITGSGKYRISESASGTASVHELSLDLRIGDREIQHFSSGLVAGGAAFPTISIPISVNGLYCFDTLIVVDATPLPANEIVWYNLVSGSTFQQGCYDPCDCPLGPELPVIGSFGLVVLQNDSFVSDFAVVNVRWQVLSTSVADGLTISGFGSYQSEDVFTIERIGSRVAYYKNGSLFYVSGVPTEDALLVDASLYSTGATITDAVFGPR